MAFPTVGTSNSGNSGANATAHTVTLPTSIASGDLLIVAFCHDDAGATVTASVTTPASGWTTLVNNLVANALGTVGRLSVFARIADGTEGTTITVTTTGSEGSAYTTYRIPASSWYGNLTDGVNVATVSGPAANANPNPPNLDPASWGTEDTMWMVIYSWDGNVSHTTYPTNYASNQLTNRWANTGGQGIASATRENAAASEDPGTATISASEQWAAVTLAVRPAGAATPASFIPPLRSLTREHLIRR